MFYVALRMLMGDTAKYISLILGLAFSTTLVVQQASIFVGVLKRTSANILSVPQPDLWVMHPSSRHYDERKAIEDTALQRVRGVEGIEWAQPLYVGMCTARLTDGTYATPLIVGVDRVSFVGLPANTNGYSPELLNQTDAIFWDHLEFGLYKKIKVGDVMELNDRRAKVVGIAEAPRTFNSNPVVYTTYERALQYAPGERQRLTFVLAKVKAGYDPEEVAQRVALHTGLGVKTQDQFFWSTVIFFLKNTGIPVNFGITVILGLIVGVAVSGLIFFNFTMENTKVFGTLKAMGVSNAKLIQMVLLQAFVVGLAGWGLGVGMAAAFGVNIGPRSNIAFLLMPHVLIFSFVAMTVTVMIAAWLSIRHIVKIEPAIVFR